MRFAHYRLEARPKSKHRAMLRHWTQAMRVPRFSAGERLGFEAPRRPPGARLARSAPLLSYRAHGRARAAFRRARSSHTLTRSPAPHARVATEAEEIDPPRRRGRSAVQAHGRPRGHADEERAARMEQKNRRSAAKIRNGATSVQTFRPAHV